MSDPGQEAIHEVLTIEPLTTQGTLEHMGEEIVEDSCGFPQRAKAMVHGSKIATA